MMYFVATIFILVSHFLHHVKPAAVNVCYLIDETKTGTSAHPQHSVEEKLQLVRKISQCLLLKGADAEIATVIYDNHSAKLAFNFKSVGDILNDGFQQMMVNQKQRRHTEEAKQDAPFSKQSTIRFFSSNTKDESITAAHSPQTMAFLTAAETVVAAESQSNHGRVPNFKVMVISDSDVFPVMSDVKNYFLNASVEINAVDLSTTGSSELQKIVSLPSAEHYFHTPVINSGQQPVVNNICARLLTAPVRKNVRPFLAVKKLLTRPLKILLSPESPQYKDPAAAADNEYSELDQTIEGASTEYKWSPHPELVSEESVQDTPEELYGADTKREICKYMHEECNTYMKGGLCTDDSAQVQGMKKFCKTNCGFCTQ